MLAGHIGLALDITRLIPGPAGRFGSHTRHPTHHKRHTTHDRDTLASHRSRFDSSYERLGAPALLSKAGEQLPGWSEALLLMREGNAWLGLGLG